MNEHKECLLEKHVCYSCGYEFIVGTEIIKDKTAFCPYCGMSITEKIAWEDKLNEDLGCMAISQNKFIDDDEVQKMDRLTVDYGKKFEPFRYVMADKSDAEVGYFKNYECFYSHMMLVQKLGEYEDLEEQSRIIKLSGSVDNNGNRIRKMTDEQLAQFLCNFKNTFGEEYEGEQSCLDWLRAKNDD